MAYQGNRPFGRNTTRGPFQPRMPGFNIPRRMPLPFMGMAAERPFFGEILRPQFGRPFHHAPRPRSQQQSFHGSNNNSQSRRNETPKDMRLPKHEYSTEHREQKSEIQPKETLNKQKSDKDILSTSIKTENLDDHHDYGKMNNIVIDEYSMDLHFNTDDTGLTGWTLHKDGFEYLWGGARASHGVKHGKVAYECIIEEALPVTMPPTERNPHVLRVGWSTDNSDLQLGEDKLSYGFGGTGKISTNSKFSDYGRPFSVGDVVTCHVDLDSQPKKIFYMINGEFLSVAFRVGSELGDKALFPHVTCKNMKLTFNFGAQWPKHPITPGFTMLQNIPINGLVRAPSGPSSRNDAELIMMVGLPACGKTVWAEKYCKEHPDKKYYMLGTNNIIDKMRIMGLTRKGNYHGRWDALIKQATGCLNVWLKVAEKRIRNYILDQTNVYFSARRRKMRNFSGYKRIACVIVNKNQVLAERTAKREKEEGKFVPVEAVMEMKTNFSLPEVGESFDEVRYIEEKPPEVISIVNAYKNEGTEFKHGTKRHAKQDNHLDTKVSRMEFGHGRDEIKPNFGNRNDEMHLRPRQSYDDRNQRQGMQQRNRGEDTQQPYMDRDRARQSYEGREANLQPNADSVRIQESFPGGGWLQQTYQEVGYSHSRADGVRQPFQDGDKKGRPYDGRGEAQQSYQGRPETQKSYGGRQDMKVFDMKEEKRQSYGGRQDTRQPYSDRQETRQPYGERQETRQPDGERQETRQPYGERQDTRQRYGERQDTHQRYGEGQDTHQRYGEGQDTHQPYEGQGVTKQSYGELRNDISKRLGSEFGSNEGKTFYNQRQSYGHGGNHSITKVEPIDLSYSHNREPDKNNEQSIWKSNQNQQREYPYSDARFGTSAQNYPGYGGNIKAEKQHRPEQGNKEYNRDSFDKRNRPDDHTNSPFQKNQLGYKNDSGTNSDRLTSPSGEFFGVKIKQEPVDDRQGSSNRNITSSYQFQSNQQRNYNHADIWSQSNRGIPESQTSQSRYSYKENYNRESYLSNASTRQQGQNQQPQTKQWYE